MSAGRRFAGVLIVLGLASVGVLASYSATWAVALVPVFAGSGDQSDPAREIALSGRDLAPLGAAMAWVGLAAIAALLATRTWGRRVTGAVVVLAGGAAGVTGLAFGLTEAATGGGGAFISAALGDPTDASATSVSISAWWLLAVLSGLAMLVCGLLAVLDGPAWPRLGARYSRSEGAASAPSAAAAWDALDRGEDPTVADEPRDPSEPPPGSMGSARPETRMEEER
jgi:uncharacterized membrane protein (TIGR02234 family)